MTKPSARRIRVFGRVQGVYFRASARAEARRLGLTGWVRNAPDGSVEAYACGEAGAIEGFLAWIETGPPHADVTEVVVSEAALRALASFEVR